MFRKNCVGKNCLREDNNLIIIVPGKIVSEVEMNCPSTKCLGEVFEKDFSENFGMNVSRKNCP